MIENDPTFFGTGPLDKLKKGLSPYNYSVSKACVNI